MDRSEDCGGFRQNTPALKSYPAIANSSETNSPIPQNIMMV